MSAGERWLPIPGYEGLYEVSDLGRIRSPRQVLKSSLGKRGYYRVNLGSGHMFNVHRLVLLAFVGPAGPAEECRHLDGDPLNNRLTNLAWGTSSENEHDKVRHGTHHNAAKTTCPQRHAYDMRGSKGERKCRTCQRAANAAAYRRRRATETPAVTR